MATTPQINTKRHFFADNPNRERRQLPLQGLHYIQHLGAFVRE